MLSSHAAHKMAMRTRHAFMAGQMSHDEFHAKRARQDIAAHNRFETLLARLYPGHKPDLITATVTSDGRLSEVCRPLREAAE
jgi:hypothetical protein